MGEGEKTAFTTTFKVSAPFPQRQPRSLTGRWHKLLARLGHPCWDLPTRMGARQAPLGHPLGTSNTREASQGSRWREDVSSASFPKEIQKKKIKFPHSLPTVAVACIWKALPAHPVLSCAEVGTSSELSSGPYSC